MVFDSLPAQTGNSPYGHSLATANAPLPGLGFKRRGTVNGWTCPECGRQFGRRNQSHECAPAMSLDAYFATSRLSVHMERPIFEAVLVHLESVGPLHVEAVEVGILFKRQRTFAELRPKRDRVVLSVLLSRPLQAKRIAKTWVGPGLRRAYFIDLRDPDEVDDELQDWLTEAYLSSPV